MPMNYRIEFKNKKTKLLKKKKKKKKQNKLN